MHPSRCRWDVAVERVAADGSNAPADEQADALRSDALMVSAASLASPSRYRLRYDSTGGSCAPDRSSGMLSSATTVWFSVPIPSIVALIVSPACR